MLIHSQALDKSNRGQHQRGPQAMKEAEQSLVWALLTEADCFKGQHLESKCCLKRSSSRKLVKPLSKGFVPCPANPHISNTELWGDTLCFNK